MRFPSWLGWFVGFFLGGGNIKGNISWCLSLTFLITMVNISLCLFNSVDNSLGLTNRMIVVIHKMMTWWPGLASPVGRISLHSNTEIQRAVAYVLTEQLGEGYFWVIWLSNFCTIIMLLFRPIFTLILVSFCSTFHYHHLKIILNPPCKGFPENMLFREISHNTGNREVFELSSQLSDWFTWLWTNHVNISAVSKLKITAAL